MKPRRQLATDVRSTIQTTLDLLEHRCESQGILVETTLADDLPAVLVDPDQLQQVFLNLASNALDAMPDGGRMKIGARLEDSSNPERDETAQTCVVITLEDTGVGIAPEDIKHVFDPFYTTKDAGRGTGLGLSVAYGIVEEHGGWFEVQSDQGVGASFKVMLPIGSARPTAGASSA
jgi:signal transduction histidine kinase